MSAEPSAQVDLFAPSLVEATTRRLRDEILSGALTPGERLIEEQICQRFSISRAPLRESLRLLVQQGLVEHRTGQDALVVLQADGVAQRPVAVPVVQAVPDGEDHRDEHEPDEKDQGPCTRPPDSTSALTCRT